jgi:hypothetical protein
MSVLMTPLSINPDRPLKLCDVSKRETPAAYAYRVALCARVQKARKRVFSGAPKMAEVLGCGQHAYEGYESRTAMPSWMFEKFCNITGVDRHWLVFGYYQPNPHPPEPPLLPGKTPQK